MNEQTFIIEKIENALAMMFCVILDNFENPMTEYETITSLYQSKEAIPVARYRSDALFHSKVKLLTHLSMRIIEQHLFNSEEL